MARKQMDKEARNNRIFYRISQKSDQKITQKTINKKQHLKGGIVQDV